MLKVRCQAAARLDAKGRLALPAALRRELAAGDHNALVLTFHKGCVMGWTPEEFERTVERPLSEADPFDTEVMDFAHALLGPAQDVDVDGQGRIRVPALLRELAGLEREVMVNSILNRVEIWDKDAWDDRFSQARARAAALRGMPRGRDA